MAYRESKTNRADFQSLYTTGHRTSDLYLSYCGIQHCPSDHSYGPTTRDEYLLHFIIGGKGFFQINGVEYSLSQNQVFLIPPHIQTYYYADPSYPYYYAWVGFNGSKVPDYLNHTGLSPEHPVCSLNVPAEDFLVLIQKMLAVKELSLPNELERVGFLYEILSLLIFSNQSTVPGKAPLNYSPETYVEYALQYIEHNYNRITVSDISEYVGINRTYLHSVFKKKLHVSPQEYLISYKLNAAKKLLDETELPISDIAAQAGYNDSLTFSKAFKKCYGCAPREYRKSQHLKG